MIFKVLTSNHVTRWGSIPENLLEDPTLNMATPTATPATTPFSLQIEFVPPLTLPTVEDVNEPKG